MRRRNELERYEPASLLACVRANRETVLRKSLLITDHLASHLQFEGPPNAPVAKANSTRSRHVDRHRWLSGGACVARDLNGSLPYPGDRWMCRTMWSAI